MCYSSVWQFLFLFEHSRRFIDRSIGLVADDTDFPVRVVRWLTALAPPAVQHHHRHVGEERRPGRAAADAAGPDAADLLHQRVARPVRAPQGHLQLHAVRGDHAPEGRGVRPGVAVPAPRERGHRRGQPSSAWEQNRRPFFARCRFLIAYIKVCYQNKNVWSTQIQYELVHNKTDAF